MNCANKFLSLFTLIIILSGCSFVGGESVSTYTNPILDIGPDPYAILFGDVYFYTQNCENKIVIWRTSDLTDLRNASSREVWCPSENDYNYHLWAPEIHYIDGKWYVYYSADNDNTDNQRIFVLENDAKVPDEGKFRMVGMIDTNPGNKNKYAIHPNTFVHKGRRYLIWCGRPDDSDFEIVQSIYIAEMENPYTLKSSRVKISSPEYEWERQWVSPDGNKAERPIMLNESPQFIASKNGSCVMIYYSASAGWTPYSTIGELVADSDADLLDAASWKKSSEPVMMLSKENEVYCCGGLSFTESPDHSESLILYHARSIPNDSVGGLDSRSPRLQKLEWAENGKPVFPIPVSLSEPIKKPSAL